MPLETATVISDLVASNPAASDGMNNADDHMRLIKAAVKNTFPNVAGVVNTSHTQFNSILSQLLGTTIYNAPLGTVGAPGYAFVGDLDTGIYSPAANRLAFAMGGADALNFAADKTANFAAGGTFAGAVAVTGAMSATGPITGPGATPIGGMIMWLTDTLPAGNGVWCWANGGTLNRTTVGAGKELFDLWNATIGGTYYGAGNGSTTFNVINMQEVVPVGKSTMGGAASPGLIGTISAGVKAVLAGLFGNDTHTLAAGNLPSHTSSRSQTITVDSAFNVLNHDLDTFPGLATGGIAVAGYTALFSRSPLTSSRTQTISTDYTNASPTALNNEQPSRVVNFIIRIA